MKRQLDDDCKGTQMGQSMTNRAATPELNASGFPRAIHYPHPFQKGRPLCNLRFGSKWLISEIATDTTCQLCRARLVTEGVLPDPLPKWNPPVEDRREEMVHPQGILVSKSRTGIVAYIPVKSKALIKQLRKDKHRAIVTDQKIHISPCPSDAHPGAKLGAAIRQTHGKDYLTIAFGPPAIVDMDDMPHFGLCKVRVEFSVDGVSVERPKDIIPPKTFARGKKADCLVPEPPIGEIMGDPVEVSPIPDGVRSQIRSAIRLINDYKRGPRGDELEMSIDGIDGVIRGSFREFFD